MVLFYIFYPFLEVLSSSILLLWSVNTFMTIHLNSLAGKLLIPFSFSFFSFSCGSVLLISIWKVFFCPHFGCLYEVNLTLPVLKEWPYIQGALQGPVVQAPLILRASCSRCLTRVVCLHLLLWLDPQAGWFLELALTILGHTDT